MLRLRDIMTTELITVSPELSLRDAMQLLVDEHVTGAPVVAQNEVIGVVSTTDLLAFAADAMPRPGESPTEPEWSEMPVDARRDDGDASTSAWFVELEAPQVTDVAERFDDLASPQLQPDCLSQYTISDVMTNVVCSLPSLTRVDEAADFMRKAAIHRVLVMDEGQLKGIVTSTDIAEAVADRKLIAHTYVFGKPSAPGGFRR